MNVVDLLTFHKKVKISSPKPTNVSNHVSNHLQFVKTLKTLQMFPQQAENTQKSLKVSLTMCFNLSPSSINFVNYSSYFIARFTHKKNTQNEKIFWASKDREENSEKMFSGGKLW